MTDTPSLKPPPRLAEDPSVAPEVQRGLELFAASKGPYDTTAGLESLQSALRAAGESSAGTLSAAASGKVAMFVAGGIATLLVAAGGIYLLARPDAVSPHAPAAPESVAPAEARPVVSSPAPSAPEPSAPEPSRELTAPEVVSPKTAPVERTPMSAVDREVAMLVRAKALVDTNPRHALTLLSRIERELPSGALNEERDGLRVIALWKLGNRTAAETARTQFLKRYPTSPLRERLAHLTEEK